MYDDEDWIREDPFLHLLSYDDSQDCIRKKNYITQRKTNDKESDKSIRKTLSRTFDLYAEMF